MTHDERFGKGVLTADELGAASAVMEAAERAGVTRDAFMRWALLAGVHAVSSDVLAGRMDPHYVAGRSAQYTKSIKRFAGRLEYIESFDGKTDPAIPVATPR